RRGGGCGSGPGHAAAWGDPRSCRVDRHQIRLRRRTVRRLHDPYRWRRAALLSARPGLGRRQKVVTIEGLSANSSHPLQKAWIAEEVPQCGYCQSGQIMKAAELLAKNPKPSRADIISHMNGNICRCGTYHRIIAAIQRAAGEA